MRTINADSLLTAIKSARICPHSVEALVVRLIENEPTTPALTMDKVKEMRAEIADEIEACENGKKLLGDPERYDSMIAAIKNVLRIVDRYEEEIHES